MPKKESEQSEGERATAGVVAYGRTMVVVIGAIEVLLPRAGWIEALLLRLLRAAYQRRLRALVVMLPGDATKEILKGFK